MASRRDGRDTSGRTWPDFLQFLLTAPKKVMVRLFQMTLGAITALLVIAVIIVVGVQCLPTTTRMVVGPLEIEKSSESSQQIPAVDTPSPAPVPGIKATLGR